MSHHQPRPQCHVNRSATSATSHMPTCHISSIIWAHEPLTSCTSMSFQHHVGHRPHTLLRKHVLRCTSILNHHMTTIILEPFEGRRDFQTTCLTTTSDIVHSMLPFTNIGSDNWCQNPRKPFAVAPHLYGAFLELSCHKFKTSQTKGFILHLRARGRAGARVGWGGMLEILWFKWPKRIIDPCTCRTNKLTLGLA